ncbi:MAG: CRISPR-associated helicase Cas3' [Deinococcaceae bacterium]
MKPEYAAHTPRAGTDDWHDLQNHLQCVTKLSQGFAKGFGEDQIETLGWLHDFGKINPNFQSYLLACSQGEKAKSEPHAIWGAALIYALLAPKGHSWKEFALPILGHHAGLSHGGEIETQLCEFVKDKSKLTSMLEFFKALDIKPNLQIPKFESDTRRELWVRMLFSCLVDADYLDTEDHFNPSQKIERNAHPAIGDLISHFETGRLAFLQLQKSDGTSSSAEVQRIRDEVYSACLKQAKSKAGFFRLTVPTGGGKTLSSLAFALYHAEANDLARIIIGIPYTSIIDQTAQILRDVLGEDAVLEHHSAITPEDDPTEKQKEKSLRARLATENWDVPLIVTTTVQLFESLFARKTGKCRKLHNLARSVIVLDEVQTLPPALLEPTLDVLRTLVEDYGASVILCTATQPAFEESHFLEAFKGVAVTEIVPQYTEHFQASKRVTYERRNKPMSWENLASELENKNQVMVILNTRKDALTLLDQVKGKGVYHLSTLLCGAHRKIMLEEIKQRLKNKEVVKLIATQVVEAGVDISFPIVYRVLGPLERIIQAAGRCNRNDEFSDGGHVIIFDPEEFHSPQGAYLVGFEKARLILLDKDPNLLHEPEIAREYFRLVYDTVARTKEGKKGKVIQEARAILDFPTVAQEYRLIEKDTVSIVVPYSFTIIDPKTAKTKTQDADKALQAWLHAPYRKQWQALGQFIVNVYKNDLKEYRYDIESVLLNGKEVEGLYRWRSIEGYDPIKGLVGFVFDPADLTRY